VSSADLALLLTQLLVILAATRAVGAMLRLAGQPGVIGEMVAGIALGPSFLGALAPAAQQAIFPADRLLPLATLSQLGVILFMFVVGLRLDLSQLRGRMASAVAISHSSIVAPVLLGVALGLWLHPALAGPGVARTTFALFLGIAMSITAFPVLARIVDERGLRGTRLGSMAIACAAIDDATAWCLLAGVVALARADEAIQPFLMTFAGAVLYAAIMVTAGRRALEWLDRRRATSADGEIDLPLMGLVVMAAVASALVTERLGVHALFGAFLAGAIIPRASGLATAVADRLEAAVGTALLPVFFAFTGLRTDIGLVSTPEMWLVFAAILAAAITGKIGASAIAARLTGMPAGEALAIGILMNTRGLMELIILNVGLEIGVIGPALFAMMVMMALVTTAMTSPLITLVVRRPVADAADGDARRAV